MGLTLAIGVWLGTMFIPSGGGGGTDQIITENTNKFNTILEIIEERYVDSVDNELLIESSIQGMIEKLDPHSSYIPARDLDGVNEQLAGKFGGVGIRFLIHNDTLVATDVMPDSPSLRAGMMPGDRLIEVDGEDISQGDVTNEKVMELLKGREGSEVKVKIYRKGLTKDLTIVRGSIGVSSIDAAIMLTPEIGFIKLNSFTRFAGEEFRAAAQTLKDQGMKKLVFDLRNNGGGYMEGATNIADEFLEAGKLIVYTEGRKEPREDYWSSSRGILEETEVVILINSLLLPTSVRAVDIGSTQAAAWPWMEARTT
jgi:carboxyl-terminal processing protease